MRKIILISLFAFSSIVCFSQDLSELKEYKFKTPESYLKAEEMVLESANFLLTHPVVKNNELNRLIHLQFIMKWMEGTPDYTFNIGPEAMELVKGNNELLGLYMAGLSKVVLDNKGIKLTEQQVYSQTKDLLVDYCSDNANNVKPSKKIKKLLKEKG